MGKRRKSKAEVQPTDDDTSGEGNASSKSSKRNRRRRSRKRKKNRARAAEKELATREGAKKERTEVPGPIADLDLSVDLGDSELRGDDAIGKLLAETAALDDQASGQPEVADIDPPDEDEPLVENLDDDLEDDLDPAAARERLIAEALAFIEGEEELTPEELATDDSGVFERGSSDIVAVEAASDAPEGSLDADDATLREGSARLKIGPDALAAIKQLRKEGLASLRRQRPRSRPERHPGGRRPHRCGCTRVLCDAGGDVQGSRNDSPSPPMKGHGRLGHLPCSIDRR